VLISQDRWQIELYQRQDAGDWLLSVVKGPEARLSLSAIGCELALTDVYERVLLP
jgi:Uma2 family endonuclease